VLANAGIQVQTATGISVTERKALTYVPVLACARVLAEDVATLPLITYERLKPPEGAAAHRCTASPPNPTTNRTHSCSLHAPDARGTWGAMVRPDGWPIALADPPWRMTGADARSCYFTTSVHRPSVGWASKGGVDLWSIAGVPGVLADAGRRGADLAGRLRRESIGLGLGAQEYGAYFFATTPGGFVLEPAR
jgi:hypothetical protein